MKRKSEPKQVPQELQRPRIVIEFEGVGRSDPNVHIGETITLGQVRDAAMLLYTIAKRHTNDQITMIQREAQEKKIFIPTGQIIGKGPLQ